MWPNPQKTTEEIFSGILNFLCSVPCLLQHNMNWNIWNRQLISLKCKLNNAHGKFAVSGISAHVPKQLLRYSGFVIKGRVKISTIVDTTKP